MKDYDCENQICRLNRVRVRYKHEINEKSSLSYQLTLNRVKTGRFKTSFAHERVRLDGDVDINLAGPLINASGVVDYQGWLAGYQLAFDTQKSTLNANNFALGYTNGDFVVNTNV